MTNKFLDAIQSGKILIAEGATGSNLQMRGLPDGKSGEAWVLENPQAILTLAKDFIAAGAENDRHCREQQDKPETLSSSAHGYAP